MEILNHVKRNGLGTLMGKYENFAQELQDALEENKKALVKLKKATQAALAEGQDKIKGIHRTARKNPWAFVGAAAGVAMILGFVLGKKK